MLYWHPVWDAGYLSLKPCDRSDVVDTWPVKDASGRQWWFLGPDGGAAQADINGKPVNIRVRRRHLCCHANSITVQRGAGAQAQCRSGRTQQQQQRQPASPAPAVHPPLPGTHLPPPVCPLPWETLRGFSACPAVLRPHPGAQCHLQDLHHRQCRLRHRLAHPGWGAQPGYQVDL